MCLWSQNKVRFFYKNWKKCSSNFDENCIEDDREKSIPDIKDEIEYKCGKKECYGITVYLF